MTLQLVNASDGVPLDMSYRFVSSGMHFFALLIFVLIFMWENNKRKKEKNGRITLFQPVCNFLQFLFCFSLRKKAMENVLSLYFISIWEEKKQKKKTARSLCFIQYGCNFCVLILFCFFYEKKRANEKSPIIIVLFSMQFMHFLLYFHDEHAQ